LLNEKEVKSMTMSGRDQAIDPSTEWYTVTGTTTLEPHQRHVLAVIPLASADDYVITLPSVSDEQCVDKLFTIRAMVAPGVLVDGEVDVQDQDDTILASNLTTDGLAADKDYLAIQNCGGVLWVVVADVTTS
jgi:hypothetical protein